jgi:hypothetical protein
MKKILGVALLALSANAFAIDYRYIGDLDLGRVSVDMHSIKADVRGNDTYVNARMKIIPFEERPVYGRQLGVAMYIDNVTVDCTNDTLTVKSVNTFDKTGTPISATTPNAVILNDKSNKSVVSRFITAACKHTKQKDMSKWV